MSINGKFALRQSRELVIERVVDAPRELVFRAWTEPAQVMRWWAPDNFEATLCVMEPRPMGRWSVCMRSPEGLEYRAQGVYRELRVPELLVLSLTWQDSEATSPLETVVSLNFAAEGAKTRFTFEQTIIATD